ncbi:TetR/AcrR family transcriptional regulator [Streptomyces sp. NPDC053079]|uniref:TetR/AcrR family transcriptional regulator n=1 Tax=Streptomyces sp. NPDC053079 TaxID=3365697 RepID=UPI0037CF39F4
MPRMTAEERRESVIRAAMSEFARGGYHGTSTEAIARRVGVSQPYLFRLFPGKQAIFLAAANRCLEETRLLFEEARKDAASPEEAHRLMAEAYLVDTDPEQLLFQMQIYVAVASAEAAGDHEFGRTIRESWLEFWDSVHLSLGADQKQTTEFWAYGMLINTLLSLGFPADHRVWAGFHLAKPH